MRIIVFIVSFLFCCAFNLKAQNDTLTIRDAFNWNVGDTLVYREYRCGYSQAGPGGPFVYRCSHFGSYGFKVISRINNFDSITYITNWFTGDLDTLIVTDLDVNVTKVGYFNYYTMMFYRVGTCDALKYSPTCDSTNLLIYPCEINYQMDTIFNYNSVDIGMSLFESGYSVSYIENIGYREIGYAAAEFFNGMSGACGISLVYYKSDSTMWMDSVLYLNTNNRSINQIENNMSIYPNPTNSNFTITFPPATKQITVTNTIGQVVQMHETIKEDKQLQLSLPQSGTYFIHVSTNEGSVTKKVIVVK